MAALVVALAITGCVRKSFVAENPLMRTDVPDIDVIRVGESYYMVSTTMYFCPGAPIMKSEDLVHWRICSYVFDCLDDDDVYNLRDGANAYGKGQWAASLRYQDGVYWCLFVANDQQKTYIYKTNDIEKGPWTRVKLDRFMHDASLFFEDGKTYVIYGNGDIRIVELEPDGSAVKAGGVDTVLLSAPKDGMGLRAEGTHFYKIGDYYYLLEIDWPLNDIRTETCWRSKELLGKYESKVVLKGEFDGRKDGVAQGAILDTPKGDWYAIMFQDRGAVGRIPTIQPVTWVDGWPIMGDNTIPMKNVTVKLEQSGEDYTWANDEFDGSKPDLVWQWNHKPIDTLWTYIERPGWLRLKAAKATGIMDARNTLTQRTVDPGCTVTTLLDVTGMEPGGRAGICAFQSRNCSIGVEMDEDGRTDIVALERTPEEPEHVVWSESLNQYQVWLAIRYEFGDKDTAYLSYSLDGENWTELDYSLKMAFTLDLFTGYRTGLFSYNRLKDGGFADFDFFHQTPLETTKPQ